MKTTDPTLRALYRLKARLGKTRSHCARIAEGEKVHLATLLQSKADVLALAQEFVDIEIRRAKGESP